jgi:hypothetical protein
MKKLSILTTFLLSILLMACDADRDSNPVINTNGAPTSFTLNTPVQSAQYVDLENNSILLTWSQPNFGYNAIATYKVQVGLVQADGSIKWNEKDGKPEFVLSTYNTCKAEVSGKNIAMEVNEIDGLDAIENYVDLGFREIAIRIHASINITSSEEVKGTSIFSNPVTFKNMRSYAVVKAAAGIYLVGSPNSWPEPSAGSAEKLADWTLFETEIGNKIFHGIFEFEAGNLEFRFYTALTGWDADSWGTQEDDAAVEVAFDADGVFPNEEFNDGSIMKGKGKWLFKGFTGGKIEMTVDLNANTVKFVKVKEEE